MNEKIKTFVVPADEKLRDPLFSKKIEALYQACNKFYDTDRHYSKELLEQVENVRRSGEAFINALYEFNNSPEVKIEDKINPCRLWPM